jgi:hypothetical protein
MHGSMTRVLEVAIGWSVIMPPNGAKVLPFFAWDHLPLGAEPEMAVAYSLHH